MYKFSNSVLRDRRNHALVGIGDWDRPNERGDVPFCASPTLRQCLLHFVESLPKIATDAEGRCAMPLQQLILRERIAIALSLDGESEPETLSLEDAHRNSLVQWFEKFGPRIFGSDAVPIHLAIEGGKLGKAPYGDARIGNRNETAVAGGRENGDGCFAVARNGND